MKGLGAVKSPLISMDKNKLKQRIQALETERDTQIARVNQVEGMIAEASYWLVELEKTNG